MLITEQSIARAMRVFILNARIPRPPGWTMEQDKIAITNRLFPAFLKALSEIEDVKPCHGFDLDLAAKMYCEGKD